jgi:hypothetical protein
MKRALVSLALSVLAFTAALAFALPALAANDAATAKAGAGASVEGGASLGGTGINNTPGALGTGIDVNAKPAGTIKLPPDKKETVEGKKEAVEGSKDADPGKASAGASRPRGSLADEADKQDEEFRRKQRLERVK